MTVDALDGPMATVLYLGIDVSKNQLVCCLKSSDGNAQIKEFGNTDSGIASLLAWIGDPKSVQASLEATSRYHRRVVRALGAAGASVEVHNPARVHALGVALGQLDKDDRIDAVTLSEAARTLERSGKEHPDKAFDELRDLSRLISTITADNAINKKRLVALEEGSKAHARLLKVVHALESQMREAKQEWLQLLASLPESKKRYDLAISVKNIGPESARVVTCELPACLDEYSKEQLCAYAGVVPRKHDSGEKKGKQKIKKGGNAALRTGLFMACSRATFITKTYKDFYDALRARGKTHKQAMIAVVHKVLRTIVSVLKRGTAWTKEPPVGGKAPISVGAEA